MCNEAGQKSGKDEAERHGPQGFTDFREGIMPSWMQECCGARMREMMSRCMARFQDAQKDPAKAEKTEA